MPMKKQSLNMSWKTSFVETSNVFETASQAFNNKGFFF
jgi:hypothetical protein